MAFCRWDFQCILLIKSILILIWIWLKFVQLTIRHLWFKSWLGFKQATSHHLKLWWSSLLTHIFGVSWPQWVSNWSLECLFKNWFNHCQRRKYESTFLVHFWGESMLLTWLTLWRKMSSDWWIETYCRSCDVVQNQWYTNDLERNYVWLCQIKTMPVHIHTLTSIPKLITFK